MRVVALEYRFMVLLRRTEYMAVFGHCVINDITRRLTLSCFIIFILITVVIEKRRQVLQSEQTHVT